MDPPAFMEQVQILTHDVLMWIGFGTLVGLLAKAIMPGRDPGGAVATLLMGIAGTVLGCAVLSYFYEGARISPISLVGFAAGTGGAFVLLAFYRILGGFWFVEGAVRPRRRVYRRPARPERTFWKSKALLKPFSGEAKIHQKLQKNRLIWATSP